MQHLKLEPRKCILVKESSAISRRHNLGLLHGKCCERARFCDRPDRSLRQDAACQR